MVCQKLVAGAHDKSRRKKHVASCRDCRARSQNASSRPSSGYGGYPPLLRPIASQSHRGIQPRSWRWSGCLTYLSVVQDGWHYAARQVKIAVQKSRISRPLPGPAPNGHRFAVRRKTTYVPPADTSRRQDVLPEWYCSAHLNHPVFRSYPYQSVARAFALRAVNASHNGRLAAASASRERGRVTFEVTAAWRQTSWSPDTTCLLQPAHAA